MRRLIALDQEEQNAIYDLSNAASQYLPAYAMGFTDVNGNYMYIYGGEESIQIEKILLLATQKGLTSP
jgi:hypothetical protein